MHPGATTTAAPTASPPPANATNHVPIAAIVAKAGNGTAALNVTFTLSGHDADGDALQGDIGVDRQRLQIAIDHLAERDDVRGVIRVVFARRRGINSSRMRAARRG